MIQMIAVLAFALVLPAQAKVDSHYADEELATADRLVSEGHVKEGLDRLGVLMRQSDPWEDKDIYWRASTALAEFLGQVENYSQAAQVLNSIVLTKIPESQPVFLDNFLSSDPGDFLG
jgi:hypothetical protein